MEPVCGKLPLSSSLSSVATEFKCRIADESLFLRCYFVCGVIVFCIMYIKVTLVGQAIICALGRRTKHVITYKATSTFKKDFFRYLPTIFCSHLN